MVAADPEQVVHDASQASHKPLEVLPNLPVPHTVTQLPIVVDPVGLNKYLPVSHDKQAVAVAALQLAQAELQLVHNPSLLLFCAKVFAGQAVAKTQALDVVLVIERYLLLASTTVSDAVQVKQFELKEPKQVLHDESQQKPLLFESFEKRVGDEQLATTTHVPDVVKYKGVARAALHDAQLVDAFPLHVLHVDAQQ